MITPEQMSELYDKQLLHENLMRYCRGVDRMDRDLIRSAYWPDSTDDHGGYVGGGQEWADAALAHREAIRSNNHHVSNVLIELDGDRARRESMFLGVYTFTDPPLTVFQGGRYRDLCEKRDGEWRILTRVVLWDWCEQRASRPGWDLVGTPEMTNWGHFHPADPIYQDWSTTSPTRRG